MRDSLYLKELVVSTPTFGEGSDWKGKSILSSKKREGEIEDIISTPLVRGEDHEISSGYEIFSNDSGISHFGNRFLTSRKHHTEHDFDLIEQRENIKMKSAAATHQQYINNIYHPIPSESSLNSPSINALDSLEIGTSASLPHPKISKKSPLFEKFGQKRQDEHTILRQRSQNEAQNISVLQAYNFPAQMNLKSNAGTSGSSRFHKKSIIPSRLDSSNSLRDSFSNNTFYNISGPTSIDSSIDATPEKIKPQKQSHLKEYSSKNEGLQYSINEHSLFTSDKKFNNQFKQTGSYAPTNILTMGNSDQKTNPCFSKKLPFHLMNFAPLSSGTQPFLPQIEIPHPSSSPSTIQQSNRIIPLSSRQGSCDAQKRGSQNSRRSFQWSQSDKNSKMNSIEEQLISISQTSSPGKKQSKQIESTSNDSNSIHCYSQKTSESERYQSAKSKQSGTPNEDKSQAQLILLQGDKLDSTIFTFNKKEKIKEIKVSKLTDEPSQKQGNEIGLELKKKRSQHHSNSPSNQESEKFPFCNLGHLDSKEISKQNDFGKRNSSPKEEVSQIDQISSKKPNLNLKFSVPINRNATLEVNKESVNQHECQPQSYRNSKYIDALSQDSQKRCFSAKNQTKLCFFQQGHQQKKKNSNSYHKEEYEPYQPQMRKNIISKQSNSFKFQLQNEELLDKESPYNPQTTSRGRETEIIVKQQRQFHMMQSIVFNQKCDKIKMMFKMQKEIYSGSNEIKQSQDLSGKEDDLMIKLNSALNQLKGISNNTMETKKNTSFYALKEGKSVDLSYPLNQSQQKYVKK